MIITTLMFWMELIDFHAYMLGLMTIGVIKQVIIIQETSHPFRGGQNAAGEVHGL